MKRISELSILAKTILTFLLVITPLYVVSLVMNMEGTKSVQDEIEKSVTASIEFYLNALETEITRTNVLQQELLVNKDLIRLSALGDQMSDYVRGQAILRILEQMNTVQRTGQYIKSIDIYIPLLDRKITTGIPIEPLKEDDFVTLYTLSKESLSPVVKWNEDLLSSVVTPSSTVSGKSMPTFLISVNYSINQIEQSLQYFKNYQTGGALIIHRDWMIYNLKQLPSQEFIALSKLVSHENGISSLKWENETFISVTQYSKLLNAQMAVLVPEKEIYGPIVRYREWFWLLCGLSVIIIFFFSYRIYSMIHRPLIRLVRSFRQVEKGDLDITIDVSRKDEFQYLYQRFNAMVYQMKVSLREVYEQRLLTQRAKLKLMQSQINPHFLNNSFFIMNEMVRKYEDEQLDNFTSQLGKYFQYITKSAADHVPLASEVEHVMAYASIQATRFAERVHVQFEPLPQEYAHMYVPRMILQPIVENAFQHSLDQKVDDGLIKMWYQSGENALIIVIEDNGDALTDERLHELQQQLINVDERMETTGIFNVHRRLQLVSGFKSGIELARSPYGGLLAVRFTIATGGFEHVQDYGD